MAINNRGQIVGGSSGNAFLWHNGAMTNLGRLGNNSALATATNNLGQVVGLASGANGTYSHAWISTSGGKLQDLGGLIPKNAGWTSLSESTLGTNDAGQIVGTGMNPSLSNDTVAFLAKPTSLGAMSAVTRNSVRHSAKGWHNHRR